MAVYTEVSDEELEEFVSGFDIGDVLSFKGIAEGVENSNYLLQTTGGQFILTLYEKRTRLEDLPFFLNLMDHLAARGLACPTPVKDRNGTSLGTLCGRPAAIVTFLQGMSARRLTHDHCHALGQAMADMHLKGADFAQTRENALSVSGWRPLFDACKGRADEVLSGLDGFIRAELDFLEANWPNNLPVGLIHADLFPDNVFFKAGKSEFEQVSGLIDFYFACTDALAYDLAICLNAWCFEPDGSLNATKARALVKGYQRLRPLNGDEMLALPILARGSALRFLLTRLYDWLNTPEGAFVKRKDPLEYYRKLRFHQGISSASAYGMTP